MKKGLYVSLKRGWGVFLSFVLVFGSFAPAWGTEASSEATTEAVTEATTEASTEDLVEEGTQAIEAEEGEMDASLEEEVSEEASFTPTVVFPHWKGYVDDTLAMNRMFSFDGYHGQGYLKILPSEQVESFSLYVNDKKVDLGEITPGKVMKVDISAFTKNGINTLQVARIVPWNLEKAISVYVPYPEVLPGDYEEEGFSQENLKLVEGIIKSDIENGFTSAQLSIIRNGRLVYENAWGNVRTYEKDGTPVEDPVPVTTDTLYDLASVTKMFSVNYALQRLCTQGEISVDAKVKDFLGDAFVEDTLDFLYAGQEKVPFETRKAWKESLTLRDLLCHQGGFPAGPRYFNINVDAPSQEYRPDAENILYAGYGADEETKEATVEAICKTPLMYEPGTKTLYSDVDYMILGLVVEKVTGMDLDSYMKATFYEPLGLSHLTYRPLDHGFSKDQVAATELNGNTRDGAVNWPGSRQDTVQGEVHDEGAYYSMGGISGHAGLFGNATDLAKLASVMLTGGYGEQAFFTKNVLTSFTAPKSMQAENWGLGWWRQGDQQRVWYFGTQASEGTIGHQGWTGTMVMIDPARNLVLAYLTNKISSPVTDGKANPNEFDGNWYTASTLGFVPQLLSIGLDEGEEKSALLLETLGDMALDSLLLVPEGVRLMGDHPAARNARSKFDLYEKLASLTENEDLSSQKDILKEAWEKVRSDHKESFNTCLIQAMAETEDGGGYDRSREAAEGFTQTSWEGMEAAFVMDEEGAVSIDMEKARPSFDSSAAYMLLLKALTLWDEDGQISPEAWKNLKPYTVEGLAYPVQEEGEGAWGMASAKGPGLAVLVHKLGAGENTYLAPRASYESDDDYLAVWDQVERGDFLQMLPEEPAEGEGEKDKEKEDGKENENGKENEKDEEKENLMVLYLDRYEAYDEEGKRDDVIYYWTSLGQDSDPEMGYGIGKCHMSDIARGVFTRITYAGAFNRAGDLSPDTKEAELSAQAGEEELLAAIGK